MRKLVTKRLLTLALAVVMVVSLATPAYAAESKTITILQTSDLHGMVNPFDYASNKETSTSLAHAAAIIREEREKDPDLLLIDTGDTTQANYIQEFLADEPNPIIDAMNYLDYDAWTLGNHEFNFGFNYVTKEIKEFEGVTLGGNFYKDGKRWIDAYHIFEVDGVKVAVFGIDAPHIPQWEKSDPTHYDNMTFTTPMEETGKILDELEGKADVIIGSVHYGLEGEYGVEGMKAVAEKYGDRIDALFIGPLQSGGDHWRHPRAGTRFQCTVCRQSHPHPDGERRRLGRGEGRRRASGLLGSDPRPGIHRPLQEPA